MKAGDCMYIKEWQSNALDYLDLWSTLGTVFTR